MEIVKIQVIYDIEIDGTNYGRDAIYYKDMAEYEAKIADGSHAAEKATRIANFENAIKNPPPPVELTKEQLEAQKAELETQIAELDVAIGKK